MLSALALRTDPRPRETFYSFAGRLAAVNGVSLHDFVTDFGLRKNGFFALHSDVIQAIAQLADLNPSQIDEMVSWTGLPLEGVRMAYRGEQIVSRAIRNPEVRGCPDCLRQDAEGASQPVAAMAMRGHWLLRHCHVCLLHRKLLVPIWSTTRPSVRDDIQAKLSELSSSLIGRKFAGTVVVPSAFDIWLDRRLETMADDTWLGQHPLHVIATMCELVGRLIAYEASAAGRGGDAIDLHRTYAAGFDCMIGGQVALEQLLDRRLNHRAPTDGPQKVFYPLYRKLGAVLTYDPGFHNFRDLIRERVLDTWPMATGEIVMGTAVLKRKLHSIASLSQETGEDSGTLRRRLAAKQIIDPGDDRPDAQITFPVLAYDRFATDLSELVFQADVREAMGATEPQFDGLVAEGLIAPLVAGQNLRRIWSMDDGLAILARLQPTALSITPGEDGWVQLQDAARQFRAPLSKIFDAVDQGRLVVGKVTGSEGYGAIHLRADEIVAMFRNPQHVGLAPSAFGVSVGVKTGGAIQLLIDQGYMTVTELTDARTGVTHQRVLDPDATSFHAQFLTVRTAAAETGVSSWKLSGLLRARGIIPFETPRGPVIGVFDRHEVLAAVREEMSSQGQTR